MEATEIVLHYTTHHNWEWIIDEAITSRICRSGSSEALSGVAGIKLKKYNDLPSNRVHRIKPTYSLFRMDLVHWSNKCINRIVPIRVNSISFAFLDPKDSLYSIMKDSHVQYCMPSTLLIPWNTEVIAKGDNMPPYPAMLKASLGSGGSGLYFVFSDFDVIEVIKAHKRRAERVEGFIEGLIADYGAVPDWSLQAIVPAVRVPSLNNCKTQIRAYVVECNGQLFLYNTLEVRLPDWDLTDEEDLDMWLSTEHKRLSTAQSEYSIIDSSHTVCDRWTDEMENECVGRGNARPYNENRNKKKTHRFVLDEVDELSSDACQESIYTCVINAMNGMREKILRGSSDVGDDGVWISGSGSNGGSSSSGNGAYPSPTPPTLDPCTSLAIAGVDLLLSRNTCNDGSSGKSSGSSGGSGSNSSGGGSGSGSGGDDMSGIVGDDNGSNVNDEFTAYIVEFNNNPAIVSNKSDKLMSERYRDHLVTLAESIIRLTVVQSDSSNAAPLAPLAPTTAPNTAPTTAETSVLSMGFTRLGSQERSKK